MNLAQVRHVHQRGVYIGSHPRPAARPLVAIRVVGAARAVQESDGEDLEVRRGRDGVGDDGMKRAWGFGELYVDPEVQNP